MDYGPEAARTWAGMAILFPERAEVMARVAISDAQVVQCTHEAKVVCASGESDDESVCDQFPTGCSRWTLKRPYWYRLEQCPTVARSFRRLMTFTVLRSSEAFGEYPGPWAGIQPLTDEAEGRLVWEPLVESDEEGVVDQPSFSSSDIVLEGDPARMRVSHPEFRRIFGPRLVAEWPKPHRAEILS